MLLKPQIQFPMFPVIYKWIESEFNRCKTESDFVEFTFNCQNEAENTSNSVKKQAYESTFFTMYSLLTGLSYESKII